GLIVAGSVAGLNAVLASAATMAAQWIQVWLLRRQTRVDLAEPADVDASWRTEMATSVKNLFPLCLFNCVQGHVTTWMLSIFANVKDVADVGALSRLGVLFTFLALPLTQLVLPVISRTQEPRRLARLCLFVLLGMMVTSLMLAGAGIVFSTPLLALLGTPYAHLHHELAWFLGTQALAVTANAAWGICYARSWVRLGWLQIPVAITAQMASLIWLEPDEVSHAIIFANISNVTGLAIAAWLMLRGLADRIRSRKSAFVADK
ncbi:MAG: hypothetical protein JNM65_00910, partial [Verrucomicrobiaceae bacterium]|nr:hypothetical protein [Verrucomicrobiaceae bacterium]